jgi:hypothetical protein
VDIQLEGCLLQLRTCPEEVLWCSISFVVSLAYFIIVQTPTVVASLLQSPTWPGQLPMSETCPGRLRVVGHVELERKSAMMDDHRAHLVRHDR